MNPTEVNHRETNLLDLYRLKSLQRPRELKLFLSLSIGERSSHWNFFNDLEDSEVQEQVFT